MFSRLVLGRRQVPESCSGACEVSVPVGTPAFFADDGIQRSSVCSRLGQHNDKNLTEPLTALAWCQPCAGIWAGKPVFSQIQKSTKPPQRRSEEGSRKKVFPLFPLYVLALHSLFLWGKSNSTSNMVSSLKTDAMSGFPRSLMGVKQNGQRHLLCWQVNRDTKWKWRKRSESKAKHRH